MWKVASMVFKPAMMVNAIGAMCAGGALAAASSGDTPEQAAVHTIGIAILGVALPVVGWLLSRQVAHIDDAIKTLDGKVDSALEEFRQLDKKLALVEHDQKRDHDDVTRLREWKDEIERSVQFLRNGGKAT